MSGRLVRLCHAAPSDVFHRVWAAAGIEDKLKLFEPPEGKKDESDIVGYGDIHHGYVQSFTGKTLFNVGSVGNPLDVTKSCYGIIEGRYGSNEVSDFSINLVRVDYDIEKAVRRAVISHMPALDEYVKELRTAKYRGADKVKKGIM